MLRCFGYAAALVVGGGVSLDAGAHEAGKHEHKSYDITDARSVYIAGVDSVSIKIGSAPSLVVTERRDRFDKITVKTTPKRLSVTARDANWFSGRDYALVLTLPAVDVLNLAGSIDGTVEGVDSVNFKLDLAGSVDLNIQGRCTALTIEAAGNVDLQAANLVCESVNVDAVGATDIAVHATQSLDVDAAGASDVRYAGKPVKISTDLAGAGSVEPFADPQG